MTTISNGESGLSVRNKLNDIWAGLDLNAYDTSIAATAVDVFVYDTSKDSDGGAWRKRTQHTSWYNETLNTATRGSRREFPAVAVIVAESDKVTIYDGDDPALPMWMVFLNTSWPNGIPASLTGANVKSIAGLNGKLVFASSNPGGVDGGVVIVSFVSDDATIETGGGWSYTIPVRANILQRNATGTNAATAGGGRLVDATVNDVAMTVLPDAPIDPATGLPVPTIAVATDGGVSVIKDDGTVVDSASSLTMGTVNFDDDNGLWYSRNTASHLLWYSTSSDYEAGDGFGDPVANDVANSYSFPLLTRTNRVAVASEIYIGGFSGATGYAVNGLMLHQPNYTDQSKGMSALITSTYNTGWMNGDIKGAFLADTDDTDLVASGELVTNGTFDSDTDWTKGTGWTISGGVASHDASGAGNLVQTLTTVAGKTYVVAFDIAYTSGPGSFQIVFGPTAGAAINASGTYYQTFVATSSSTNLSIFAGATAVGSIDNISVKLADADRSVSANGLIVNGTVTRSPVATGAELVAYSGFSASNYLEQPYNADLDFGTGDFCVMGWVNVSSGSVTARNQTFFDRYSAGGLGMFVRADFSTGVLNFVVGDGTGSTSVKGTQSIGGLGWVYFAAIRSNGVAYVYQNGALVGSGANARSMNATVPSWVGNSQSTTANYTQGSLALLRISATAPTAEQIARIYQDEKVLFQENAACTLYGASDAVTALAHDPVTDLLHVGTSAGRSVFQGLRRVSNTTTAVGTAISASNSLVVEE